MSKLLLLTTIFTLQLLVINVVLSKPLDDGEPNEATQSSGEAYKIPDQFAGLEDDEDDEDEGDICAICRDDFVEEAPLVLMCDHKFHFKCLEEYNMVTGMANKCLYCMRELKTKDNIDLPEYFRSEEQKEVVGNKLKIGILAGYGAKPGHWYSKPYTWHENGIYW